MVRSYVFDAACVSSLDFCVYFGVPACSGLRMQKKRRNPQHTVTAGVGHKAPPQAQARHTKTPDECQKVGLMHRDGFGTEKAAVSQILFT